MHTKDQGPDGLVFVPSKAHLYSSFRQEAHHPRPADKLAAEKSKGWKNRHMEDEHPHLNEGMEGPGFTAIRAQFVGDLVSEFKDVHPVEGCEDPGSIAWSWSGHDALMMVACEGSGIRVMHNMVYGHTHHKDLVEMRLPGFVTTDDNGDFFMTEVSLSARSRLSALATSPRDGRVLKMHKERHEVVEVGPTGLAEPTGICQTHDKRSMLLSLSGERVVKILDLAAWPSATPRPWSEELPGVPLAIRRRFRSTNYWVLLRVTEWFWGLRSLFSFSQSSLDAAFGGKSVVAELDKDGKVVRYLENHEHMISHAIDIEDSGEFLHFASSIAHGSSYWRKKD